VSEIDELRARVEELERRVEILFTKTGARSPTGMTQSSHHCMQPWAGITHWMSGLSA
jgi:hypothetical protein